MKPINSLPPFKRFCVTIGNLPSSYVDSMSYYECLMWLCKYLKDTVIPAVNENAEAVNELINWFNNLDVQDEVDKKLDEMVESGQLQEIISEYLNSKAIFGFDTINDMINSTNLINGSYAKTMGSTLLNNGYGAVYKIRTVTNDDVIDGIHIIAMKTDDTLVAELILTNNSTYLTPEMFGCIGDGIVDDTENMQKCIDEAIKKKQPILTFGTYLITDSLLLSDSITIMGNRNYVSADLNNNEFTFIYSGDEYLFDTESEYINSLFENITIKGDGTNKCFKNTGYRNRWNNVTIYNFAKGIHFYGDIDTWRGENNIDNCYFYNVTRSIEIDDKLYADSYISKCTFKSGEYSIYGAFNAWCLDSSHDYSLKGIHISNFANSQITNNYLDHSNYMPFIYASGDIAGGSIIANNKFLAGSGISDVNALIQIDNNVSGYNLTIDNNVASGEKYSTAYFVQFVGSSGVTLAMSGNQMFKIVGKILKDYPLASSGSMINYGGYKTVESISGTANFNQCYFNNGIAHIILEVSKAGVTLGHLPFNPAVSVRVPIYNSSKNTWGTALLNNSNGNITIPNNFAGDTVLINATYLVYYNGTFGDNS